jgi:hypothetical protein
MARGFRDQFDAATLKVMKKKSAEAKARLMGFCAAVVDDTPVLTGALKGSWQLLNGNNKNFDRTTPLDPSGLVTKARLQQKIKYLPIHMDWKLTFGSPVKYAHKIEFEGWSQKAPQGMVRKNIAIGGERLKALYLGVFE